MTPAPSSTPDSQEPPALALRRLERAAPQLAEAWLVRLFARSTLERVERLAAGPFPSTAPELITALLRVAGESESARHERLSAAADELVAAWLDEPPKPQELVRGLAVLHSLLADALEEAEGSPDEPTTAAARLADAVGELQAAAVAGAVEARERWLNDLAHTDPLTGLYNRRHLDSRLDQLAAAWRRHAQPFALLLVDVDQLKRINDAHGHAAGDRVLIDLAAALTHSIRASDTALRIGGDEFCVLAPHQRAADAASLAERLIAATAKPPTGADAAPTSISVGVVACPEHGDQPAAMLELADRAMYTAKSTGRAVTIAPTS